MRIRRAVVGLALGSALALGATAVPAQAAEGSTTTKVSATASGVVHPMAGWHFYRAYWSKAACVSEGEYLLDQYGYDDYSCPGGFGSDKKFKYFLYIWS